MDEKPVSQLLTGIELTYFNFPGRGEATRLALSIGGIDFKDTRIEFADWPKVKPTTPWGNVPFLTLTDGSRIAQQRNMLRFVGKEVGLCPEDSLEMAKVDELLDVIDDTTVAINAAGRGMETEAKLAARAAAVGDEGKVGATLAKVDAFIGASGSDGHCVGSSLTIADLLLFTQLGGLTSGFFDGVPTTCLDGFPNIQASRKATALHPAVMAWYDAMESPPSMCVAPRDF